MHIFVNLHFAFCAYWCKPRELCRRCTFLLSPLIFWPHSWFECLLEVIILIRVGMKFVADNKKYIFTYFKSGSQNDEGPRTGGPRYPDTSDPNRKPITCLCGQVSHFKWKRRREWKYGRKWKTKPPASVARFSPLTFCQFVYFHFLICQYRKWKQSRKWKTKSCL